MRMRAWAMILLAAVVLSGALVMGTVLAGGAAAAAASGRDGASEEPAGASVAWTSTHPALVDARALLAAGRFAEAADRAAHAPERERDEFLEIARRIRLDYALDEAGVLARVRRAIPDAGVEDVRRWREAGVLQHRIIDGSVAYFRREPANLLRFAEDAIRRRRVAPEPPAPAQQRFSLHEHLAAVIADARRTGRAEVVPVRHKATFTLTVPGGTKGAREGSLVRAWLPFPQEYRQQREVRLISAGPGQAVVTPNGLSDGRVQRHAQRTVYLEQRIADPARPVTFTAEFEYVSFAHYVELEDERAKALPFDHVEARYTAERPPHILLTPALRAATAEAVAGEINPLRKARRIFEWVDANVRYHAEEEYSTLPSFSEAALSRRRGDCGVQATLFIAMCRAAGIPARWQSGWQTKPGGQMNMHDWAEFYVEPWGWLAADPSYGLQRSDDPAVRWFYFGHQDSYRMIVNLDYGSPLVPEKASLRSEPADFQRGEVELDGRNLYYDEWDYAMKLEYR